MALAVISMQQQIKLLLDSLLHSLDYYSFEVDSAIPSCFMLIIQVFHSLYSIMQSQDVTVGGLFFLKTEISVASLVPPHSIYSRLYSTRYLKSYFDTSFFSPESQDQASYLCLIGFLASKYWSRYQISSWPPIVCLNLIFQEGDLGRACS